MTSEELLRGLEADAVLRPEQARLLRELDSGRVFPVRRELRTLFYLGVLSFVAGLGALLKEHFHLLGHASILGGLSLGAAACFAYCARRAGPWSPGRVEAPTLAFDYLLFLGCALLGAEAAYLEAHFDPFGRAWDAWLLLSAALFGGLAYRCDNRLVLAAALVNLGLWSGVRLDRWGLDAGFQHRTAALYGAALCAAGLRLEARGLKAHFTDVWLNLGANALGLGLLAGVGRRGLVSVEALALAGACAAGFLWARREGRGLTLVLAVLYGYVGLSVGLLDLWRPGLSGGFLYFIVSAAGLGWGLVRLREGIG